ncbi:hypothetical protein DFH07DRAFT_960760 [Mycena maculata]|uniref:Uncharacterized protein n=1 Tax=Mycena maculata TaxID=230809 RepID=A0AAD7NAA1_9AGAR|nr:hypothetical protein DFH07DRAFT_960760 [Mycena maculata]
MSTTATMTAPARPSFASTSATSSSGTIHTSTTATTLTTTTHTAPDTMAMDTPPPSSTTRVRFDAECVLIPDVPWGGKRPRMLTKSYSLPLWRKHREEEQRVLKVALPRHHGAMDLRDGYIPHGASIALRGRFSVLRGTLMAALGALSRIVRGGPPNDCGAWRGPGA